MTLIPRPKPRSTPPSAAPAIARMATAALAIVAAAALFACAPRSIGTGVVLWAPKDGGLETGQQVRVLKESQLQGVYYVRPEGEKGKELLEIPAARVRLFKDEKEAGAFRQAYAPLAAQFAFALKDALPVREKPDSESRKVYMLREGQLVKVVGRGEQPESVGAYQNYWYQVLTDDGYEGFCFGQYLRAFAAEGDPEAQAAKLMTQDPQLDHLLSTTWRPEYFLDMMRKGRIDLARFRTDVGLFPEPENSAVLLVTPSYSLSFEYKGVEKAGAGRYLFTGTELRVTFADSDESRVVVSYLYKGRQFSVPYYAVTENLDELIAREQDRRRAIYDQLAARGRILQSTTYGTIELQDGQRFRWTGLGGFAARISARASTGSGTVDFPYFAAKALAGSYQGVITFRFDGDAEGEGTSFLFNLENRGIRLALLRPQDIVEQEATGTDISPLILFFTFSGA